ncbi:MAG: transcriptional repressor NrdR [Candidatus Aenigmarchaeota archaeon]|nr:transcriptional repressor NrdR [Candidatus Aenigmarchaeota archaeon]
MRCPYCFFEETKVVDKRDNEEVTRRRRECLKCEKRFTTYEKPEISIVVIKKDGAKEQFDREKIKDGILKACKNRPVTGEDIERTVDEIEAQVKSMDSTEIQSQAIGELVMKKLKKLDEVAYIRFASVYRSFGSAKEFEQELKAIRR